eukprot:TRINITY_DN9368_c0_g1_i1.p1 TRINITY_DN9368_c0_g1~~TRINITY_DN9368_c0_g1_i1.p1  ORF type:complete len:1446 (+),score=526.16 TRINITY_DN9368_c0_g1_i1:143-4480(+)
MEYVSLSHSSTDVGALLARMNQVHVGAFRVALIQRLSGKTRVVDRCFRDYHAEPLGLFVFVPKMEEAVLQCTQAGEPTEREDIALRFCNNLEAARLGDRQATKPEETSNRGFENEAVLALDRWYMFHGSKYSTPCEIDVFAEPPLLRIALIEFFHFIDKQNTGLIYFKELLVHFMDAAMKVQKSLTADATTTIEGYSMVADRVKGCFARMCEVVHVPNLKGYLVLVDIGKSRSKSAGEGPVQVTADQALRIVDENTFNAKKSIPLVDGAGQVFCMCFIPDIGQGYICMSYSDGRVRFVDAYSNQVKMVYPGFKCQQRAKHQCGHSCAYVKREDPNSAMTCMRWNAANKRLYVGNRQGEFMVWDVKALERVLHPQAVPFEPHIVYRSRPHTAAITGLCFLSPSGDVIASGSLDCAIGITDLEQKFKCRLMQGHQAGVRALAYNEHASYLVSASSEEHEPLCWAVNVTNVKPLPMRDGRSPHTQEIVEVVSVPHSSWTISMDCRGMIKVWDLLSISCVQTLQCDVAASVAGGWRACAYNATKRQFLTAAQRKLYVFEYNVKTKNNDPLAACTYEVISTHYVPGIRQMISVSSKNVRYWDTETGQQIDIDHGISPLPNINDQICCSCLSQDEAHLYLGTASGVVLCVVIASGERVRQWHHPSGFKVTLLQCIGVEDLEASLQPGEAPPVDTESDVEATTLVALADDGSIQVVTDNGATMSGKSLSKKTRERVDVHSMAYDADHKLLFLGSGANVITVFEVATWTVRGVCPNRPIGQAVTGIAPCLPHEMFASGDAMGGIHIWGLLASGPPILLKRFVTDHPKGLVYTPGVVKLAWSAPLSCLVVADDNEALHYYDLKIVTQATLGNFLEQQSMGSTFLTAAPSEPVALPISELTQVKYELVRTWQTGFSQRINALSVLDSEDGERQYVMASGDCSVVIWDTTGNQISQLSRERVMTWNVGLTSANKAHLDCPDVALADSDDDCPEDDGADRDRERESRQSNPPTPHTLVENLSALLDEETNVQISMNALEAEEAKKRFQSELRSEIDRLHTQLQKMCPTGRHGRKPPSVPLDCCPYNHQELLNEYKLRETISSARSSAGGKPLSLLYRVAHGLPVEECESSAAAGQWGVGSMPLPPPPLSTASPPTSPIQNGPLDLTLPSVGKWTTVTTDDDAAVAAVMEGTSTSEGWQSLIGGRAIEDPGTAAAKKRPKRKAIILEDEEGNITVDVRPKTNSPPRTPVDQKHPSYMTAKRAQSVQVGGLAYDKQVRTGEKTPVDVVYGSGREFIRFLKQAAIAYRLPSMKEKQRRARQKTAQAQGDRKAPGRMLEKEKDDEPSRRAAGVKPSTNSALYHLPPVHYRKLFETQQPVADDRKLLTTSSLNPLDSPDELAAAVGALMPLDRRMPAEHQPRPTKLAPMHMNGRQANSGAVRIAGGTITPSRRVVRMAPGVG